MMTHLPDADRIAPAVIDAVELQTPTFNALCVLMHARSSQIRIYQSASSSFGVT